MTDKNARSAQRQNEPETRKMILGIGGFLLLLSLTLIWGALLAAAPSRVRAAPALQAATDTPTSTDTLTPIDTPTITNTPIAPSHIVISEFRFTGSAGASDEFVEIFNPTGGNVNIGNWKIRASNSSSTPAVGTRYTFPSNTIIQPGTYYLITGSTFDDGVSSDGTLSTGITNDGGVAIVDASNIVVDAVGLSTNAASAFSGAVSLVAIPSGSDTSYERKLGGLNGSCYDTDTAADFSQITSNAQNTSSSPTYCAGVPTFTPTPTATIDDTATAQAIGTQTASASTATAQAALTLTATGFTRTPTPTLTFTPTNYPMQKILINEVAWAGTKANSSDEWIELYNPSSTADITLNGWQLVIISLTGATPITINLDNKIILHGEYYLIEDREIATNIASDQRDSRISLSNSGNILLLNDSLGRRIDSANFNGGAWPAGKGSPNYCSMERASASAADNDYGWFTNNNTIRRGLDAAGNPICGTPKGANWAYTVTITPTKVPTRTKTPTRTRTFTPTKTPTRTKTPTISPLTVSQVVINEFLTLPRFDANQDGVIDSGDSFIEIENLSTIPVSVTGWVLDDQDGDSSPYTLPGLTLEPHARQVYFASETHIVLSNAGDSVRLFHGQFISDAFTYPVIRVVGQSWCRLPDGNGKWTFGCEPTPHLVNRLASSIFVNDQPQSKVCLSSTTLAVVYEAECASPGLAIWSPEFWLGDLQKDFPLYIDRQKQVDIIE